MDKDQIPTLKLSTVYLIKMNEWGYKLISVIVFTL